MNLRKLKTKIIAFAMATIMPINADAVKIKDSSIDVSSIFQNYDDPFSKNTTPNEKLNQKLQKYKLRIINEAKAKEYMTYFDEFKPVYRNNELYITSQVIDEMEKKADRNNSCHYVFDGDVNALVEKIKTNTKEYLKTHPEYTNFFSNAKASECLAKALTSIIKSATNNINEDLCHIKDLSIVISELPFSCTGAYGIKDNIIKISKDVTNIMRMWLQYNATPSVSNILDSISDEKMYEMWVPSLLHHELNHVRSWDCSCLKDNIRQALEYQADNVVFYMESAASSEMYNVGNDKLEISFSASNFSYPEERKYEALLFTLALFSDKDISEYYNAILDNNYNAFCNFFDVKTNEEKYNLYKIIYAIDSLKYRSDFYKKIVAKTGDPLCDVYNAIGNSYRNDIFRMVLSNMVEYTNNHHDFTLKENLAMFDIIKHIVKDNTINDEQANLEYCKLENKYLEFLSNSYNISQDELNSFEPYIEGLCDYLYDMASGKEVKQNSYSMDANRLFERFPILKPIIIPSDIASYSNSRTYHK